MDTSAGPLAVDYTYQGHKSLAEHGLAAIAKILLDYPGRKEVLVAIRMVISRVQEGKKLADPKSAHAEIDAVVETLASFEVLR
jgi:hypothetical protein